MYIHIYVTEWHIVLQQLFVKNHLSMPSKGPFLFGYSNASTCGLLAAR